MMRLLPFDRCAAVQQLASSEAILDEVGRNGGPPTLRIYGWPGSTMLLGSGQSASAIDRSACQRLGIPLLRRMSGGTAVLHTPQSLSLQLTLPANHPLVTDDIHRNFQWFSEWLIAAMSRLGISARWMPLDLARSEVAPSGLSPVCYSTFAPFEVGVGGRKLFGHGQIRRVRATAMLAMVYQEFNARDTVRLLNTEDRPVEQLERDLAGRVTDLRTAVGREVSIDEYVDAVTSEAEVKFGRLGRSGSMTNEEIQRTDDLARTKYGNPDWILRR